MPQVASCRLCNLWPKNCSRCSSACRGPPHSEGFEPKSFVMRFGRVSVMRRRRGCDASGSSELAFDKARSLPDGELADDVREGTST